MAELILAIITTAAGVAISILILRSRSECAHAWRWLRKASIWTDGGDEWDIFYCSKCLVVRPEKIDGLWASKKAE